MKVRHTPGPWTLATGAGAYSVIEASDVTIAHAKSQAHPGEQLANARLIAAAPLLLEACKALMFIASDVCICHAMKEGYTCPYCQARAAIAEVEGK